MKLKLKNVTEQIRKLRWGVVATDGGGESFLVMACLSRRRADMLAAAGNRESPGLKVIVSDLAVAPALSAEGEAHGKKATDWDHRIIDGVSFALGGTVGQNDDVKRLLAQTMHHPVQKQLHALAEIAVAFIRWSQDLKRPPPDQALAAQREADARTIGELQTEHDGWKREAGRLLKLANEYKDHADQANAWRDILTNIDKQFGCDHVTHGAEDAEQISRHVREMIDENERLRGAAALAGTPATPAETLDPKVS